MSITARIISPDLQKQIELLQRSPQILDKYFRVAIEDAVAMTYYAIEPNIPKRTGKAVGSFRREVFGYASALTGMVGWWGDDVKAWYINIVEHGARKHSLKRIGRGGTNVEARKRRETKLNERLEKKNFRRSSVKVWINGQWRTIREGIHPGISKRGFMAAGFSAVKPLVIHEFERAGERALAEQVVK